MRINNVRKSRGRPPIHATPITVRLPPKQLAALDQFVARMSPGVTRPEAIRRLLDFAASEQSSLLLAQGWVPNDGREAATKKRLSPTSATPRGDENTDAAPQGSPTLEALTGGVSETNALAAASARFQRQQSGRRGVWRGERYGARGITAWFVKEQIRSEVQENDAFAEALFAAGGLPLYERITGVSTVGSSADLVIDAETRLEERLRLVVTCTLADPNYLDKAHRHLSLIDPEIQRSPPIRGALVLLAPRMFFEKTWTGTYPEGWTFESLRQHARPSLAGTLDEAITRGEARFQNIGKGPRPDWYLYAR